MSRFVELGEGDNFDIDLSEIQAVVFPVESEEVTIEPTTEEQVILPTSDRKLIGKATVKAVTKDIDANIKPENIVLGKTILGVEGNVAPDKPDQTKTTIPTRERQVVRADVGFELAENIVEPIPEEYVVPQGELLIDENNKTFDVKNYESAKVEIAEKPKGEFYVKVFDFDGEQIGDTVWLNNGDTFTVPTAPPTHDRLVFQEWTCTQDIVDGVVTIDGNNVLIGPIYTTASGLTEIEIELTPEIAPNIETDGFIVTVKGSATKYWDYENDTTISDTSTTHTYYAYGKYIIAFSSQSVGQLLFGQTASESNKYVKHVRLNVQRLSSEVFAYCTNLETVTISNLIRDYEYYAAFSNCYNLKCIISNVGGTDFTRWCYSLKTVIYGNSLKYLNMLNSCSNLENFVIPKKTTAMIPDGVIQYCYNMRDTLYIPHGVTRINGYAFSNCASLKKIVVPSTLTTFGYNVFESCYSLKEVEGFENTSVAQVTSSIFTNCRSLKKLKFPSTITSIGSSAFRSCFVLELYDFSLATQVPTLSNTNAISWNVAIKIVVPDALYDEWVVATNWSTFANNIFKASEVEL